MNKYLVRDNRGEAQKRGKNVVNVVLGGSYSPPRSPDFSEEVLSIQSLPDLVISFSSKDYEGVNPHHNAALVVTLDIFDNEVRRMLIDNGSSVNILFKHTVDRMQLGSVCSNECREDPLYGFSHNLVPIQGTLYLPVIFGSAPNQVTHVIKFYVINAPSSYNGIIGRSALTMMQAITSISHLKIKFPIPTGVGDIKGDYGVAETCYNQGLVMAETHQDNKRKATVLRKQQSMKKHRPRTREEANKTSPEGLESNQVMVVDKENQVPDQASPTMQATKESEQANFYLKKNSEARIHQMVSNKEQAKIEVAVEIEEVQVDESNSSKKVKVGSGLEEPFKERLVSLLREYRDLFTWSPRDMPGLHESIAMHSLDVNPNRKPVKQKRRNFAPERQKAIDEEVEKLLKAGIIKEIKYPEWLANVVMVKKSTDKWRILTSAGSTYQRAMNKIFKSQIGRNLECYIDDMISKSTTIPGHVKDLKECFDNLRKNQLKLNPEKCTFGVGAGKFLGFMISNRGIKANPEKIKAIQEMKAPRTQKDVQKLAGSLAALMRFISKLAERCLPFFDLLKGATNRKEVNWNPECQKAFEEIKYYLSQPPVLTKAQPGEPLSLYLSAEAQAVGAALIREEKGTHQPVYYVSQVLKDAETRYPRLEKFVFALVTTSRKLRHNFQGREIRVVTNQPLRKIIHKPDVSGRLVNWAMELSQFNLSFIPRTAIKAQALADFIIECNFPEEEPESMNMDQEPKKDIGLGAWTLKVDGSSTSKRSGAGLILKSPEGFKIQTSISFGFPATNNRAEYEALIAGLKLSRTLRVKNIKSTATPR
ncbi:uncharacterized protein LOC141719566 [Apium graveolens]|uniref:uncharacterized protein LOC141719566 n=1 Tax=Apium graveolens TaxID=4045 RepID=UPI003D790FAE